MGICWYVMHVLGLHMMHHRAMPKFWDFQTQARTAGGFAHGQTASGPKTRRGGGPRPGWDRRSQQIENTASEIIIHPCVICILFPPFVSSALSPCGRTSDRSDPVACHHEPVPGSVLFCSDSLILWIVRGLSASNADMHDMHVHCFWW